MPFENANTLAEVRQANPGGQPGHAGADNDRVVHVTSDNYRRLRLFQILHQRFKVINRTLHGCQLLIVFFWNLDTMSFAEFHYDI